MNYLVQAPRVPACFAGLVLATVFPVVAAGQATGHHQKKKMRFHGQEPEWLQRPATGCSRRAALPRAGRN